METKEIKIDCPEGYEIDKENSTFECIKFKPVTKRWRDGLCEVKGYHIGSLSWVRPINCSGDLDSFGIFATEKQAKSALAMAKISQIMANDGRFGGVVTDEEWLSDSDKFVINRNWKGKITFCKINNYRMYSNWSFLAFHTEEQADLFMEENMDLIKDYFMVD